jgi:GNAT superfamily N-acetyltransferase
MALEPDGCFVAEFDGAAAGTATTIRYGDRIAWIGMVLAHPDFRRQGIGRALLGRCIEYLEGCGVAAIKLDATPLGKTLYEKLGFVEEWTLTRWRGLVSASSPKALHRAELPKIAALDENAFGANRLELLERLARDSETAFLDNCGFAMVRRGAKAFYLGPVIANTAKVAIELVESLLPGGEVIMDIPDFNKEAGAWAQRKGFIPERQLTRMRLGEEIRANEPGSLFAIAAPEVG